jgi:glutamate--cysteine ligase
MVPSSTGEVRVPHQRRTLSTTTVANYTAELFEADGPDCFGVELEWPVHRQGDVAVRPTAEEATLIQQVVLPAGGRVTFEPGGQVELSTAPATSVEEALRVARTDAEALHAHLTATGLEAELLALDDRRPPQRILQRPRYQAMERFFAEQGLAGTWMMCNTASTQVNVSHAQGDPRQRWNALHLIGPALIAAFANSPGVDSEGRRWVTLRQATWWSIDPARTRPVGTVLPPERAWQDYAFAADVMFICDEGASGATGTAVPPGLPFGRWMRDGHEAGWPTIDDYYYHLSTLFPPVRPRCWLELRVLDALPEWIRDVAVLVVATACTVDSHHELEQRLPDTTGLWVAAARQGLDHPVLGKAARTMLDVVSSHLDSVTTDTRHREIVEDYAARYTMRGRAPESEIAARSVALEQRHTPVLAGF